ncbi:MAG: 3'(2'),5'-bisphosphate nucleotidase CysQ [Gemmatimonadota bacterium]
MPSRDLDTAREAARLGGAAAMQFYGSATATLKAGGSPVTAADHASSDAITAHLRAAFPDDAILCEETADDPARLVAERLWIVDPLDGTKEFLAQNGEFAVMIGLAIRGRPVAGVVYLPATDTMFYAADGAGAWVEQNGKSERLASSAPGDGLRIVTSRSHADATVEALCASLPISERRPSGSVGIKCSLIARGEADLYAHPVPYMGEWDTCAPEVILREAGGSVTDCNGRPLRYNKPVPTQPDGILACAPGLLARVLPAVAASIRRRKEARA